jgi:hypothetical protein
MTNHVLFVHGVNVDDNEEHTYANDLITLINDHKLNTTKMNPTLLWWNGVTTNAEGVLLKQFQASKPAWDEMYFKKLRETDLLQFVGDAALYISQHISAEAINHLYAQITKALENYDKENDALHIVAHSWGTVVLFDVLFAARWNKGDRRNKDIEIVNAINQVEEIRNKFLGLGEDKKIGIKIGSINTMGSPIAFYSLLLSNGNSSHDISTNLQSIIGNGLIWQNFINRGDLIAYPLEQVLPAVLGANPNIFIKDFLIPDSIGKSAVNFINKNIKAIPIEAFPFVSLNAHSSYWKSEFVAQKIVKHFVK